MNTLKYIEDITQPKGGYPNLIPSVITTKTTSDFIPDANKLTSTDQFVSDGIARKDTDIVPTLTKTVLIETAAELKKKDIKFVDKPFSRLTINEIYNNTIKSTIAIINDVSDIVSDKEILTNTEIRRKIADAFLRKERRMYVGILLILLSFILYFIDSSA